MTNRHDPSSRWDDGPVRSLSRPRRGSIWVAGISNHRRSAHTKPQLPFGRGPVPTQNGRVAGSTGSHPSRPLPERERSSRRLRNPDLRFAHGLACRLLRVRVQQWGSHAPRSTASTAWCIVNHPDHSVYGTDHGPPFSRRNKFPMSRDTKVPIATLSHPCEHKWRRARTFRNVMRYRTCRRCGLVSLLSLEVLQ